MDNLLHNYNYDAMILEAKTCRSRSLARHYLRNGIIIAKK